MCIVLYHASEKISFLFIHTFMLIINKPICNFAKITNFFLNAANISTHSVYNETKWYPCTNEIIFICFIHMYDLFIFNSNTKLNGQNGRTPDVQVWYRKIWRVQWFFIRRYFQWLQYFYKFFLFKSSLHYLRLSPEFFL